MILTPSTVETFRMVVYKHYEQFGRALPWRTTSDPYKILVAEVMSQQTQIERVVDKYLEWVRLFPDFEALANASLREVLVAWSGLGYNRRARFLQQAAKQVLRDYNGSLPHTKKALLKLTGIGPYTTAAIQAFAFNLPVVVIDTNIRSVYIHQFFSTQEPVRDPQLIPYIEQTMDTDNPKHWYNALMDYGAYVKSLGGNPGRKSAHYVKQGRFEGSRRQVRGAVLKLLVNERAMTEQDLRNGLGVKQARLQEVLYQLVEEHILKKEGEDYLIPDENK